MIRPAYVLAALLTALLVMMVVVGESRYYERVAQAKAVVSEAAVLEAGGNLKGAYERYSRACEGDFEIKREDVPKRACEGVERLWVMRRSWGNEF